MAVHLSHDAKLLLLDEPTGGLDPVARDEMLDIMREHLVKNERTVLFSTHITGDLERIADLIVYISRGAVSFCGEKDFLTSKYCVVRGGVLPAEKKKSAIGLREHSGGYECLMELSDIGGLPPDTAAERAAIDDVVVYMERSSKNA
jgi:ABC-2 type transport system ATP-binding protein